MTARVPIGASAWSRRRDRPWVLGHRGARRVEPENTLQAFERAMQEGADGVELDVRLSRDGHVIVLHDPTLTHMTGGACTRSADELSLQDISSIELQDGARAPTLAEVLGWAQGAKARVNIEVKQDVRELSRLIREVVRQVRTQEDGAERLLLSSFHPGAVWELARALPDFAVGWLVHRGQSWLRSAPAFRWLGASLVHPELALATDARVKRWHSRGARVAVWTVNDADAARRLDEQGVDILISDEPGLIVKTFAGADANTSLHRSEV